jgi:hypothetical protein
MGIRFDTPPLIGVTRGRLAIVAAISVVSGFQWAFYYWNTKPISEAFGDTLELAAATFIAALPALAAVTWSESATKNAGHIARACMLAAALLVGSAVFGVIVWAWEEARYGSTFASDDPRRAVQLVAFAMWGITMGGFLTLILALVSHRKEIARRLHQEEIGHIDHELQMAEANLQRLQSQIEPHFLFNTLANAKQLWRLEPSLGRALWANLVEYIRIALPDERNRPSSVEREIALAKAYVDIFAVRTSGRIRALFDVPAELESAELPPLMLGTLVENAIEHGVGPRAQGGTVKVACRRDAENLVVEVSDDGVGFRGQSGSGIGLANTRARLKYLYGENGELHLRRNRDAGVVAQLRLPLRWWP